MAAARRKAAFEPKRTDIDGVDLFIVDYDLVQAKNEDYLTGETVAYLGRCYSTCGVIVGLNQYWRQPTFDLTLRQQLDSFADLNISASDLNNPGLWQKAPWKSYRPWSWPVIINLVSLMRRRVVDVEKTEIDTNVVDFLGFPRSVIERLPASSLEMLGSSSKRAEAATLKDVLKSPILGLRGREASERKRFPSQDARIIAARLTAWLNTILAPQDVLVDAPHLAERCPSVVSPSMTQKQLSVTTSQVPDAGIFRDKNLDKARLKKTFWFDRPIWFWTEIERLRLTQEVREPWKTNQSRLVFCEDTSSFRRRSDSKSFQSDLISPYRTRHVSRLSNIEYQPAHRLALA
jgi:hypothetical protein